MYHDLVLLQSSAGDKPCKNLSLDTTLLRKVSCISTAMRVREPSHRERRGEHALDKFCTWVGQAAHLCIQNVSKLCRSWHNFSDTSPRWSWSCQIAGHSWSHKTISCKVRQGCTQLCHTASMASPACAKLCKPTPWPQKWQRVVQNPRSRKATTPWILYRLQTLLTVPYILRRPECCIRGNPNAIEIFIPLDCITFLVRRTIAS